MKQILYFFIFFIQLAFVKAQDTLYAVSIEYPVPGTLDYYADIDQIIITGDTYVINTLTSFKVRTLFQGQDQPNSIFVLPNNEFYIIKSAGEIFNIDINTGIATIYDTVRSEDGAALLNDSLVLLADRNISIYNVVSKEEKVLTNRDSNIVHQSVTKYKEKWILTAYIPRITNMHTGRFREIHLDSVPVVVKDIIPYPDSIGFMRGLGSFPVDCDSTTLYSYSAFRGNLGDPFVSAFHRINYEKGIYERLFLSPKVYLDIFSPSELRAVPCELSLDLDVDDSSGANGSDFREGQVCAQQEVWLADIPDVLLLSDLRIDSMRVSFVSGDLDGDDEELGCSNSNVSITTSMGTLMLHALPGSTKADWDDVVEQLTYVNHRKAPTPGWREIEVVVYAGHLSDTAFAFLNVLAGADAGLDTTLMLCQNTAALDLRTLARQEQGLYAYFSPSPSPDGFTFDPSDAGIFSFSYFKESGSPCSIIDEAVFTIEVPEVMQPDLGADVEICFGDTIVLASTGGVYSNYLWSTGASTSSLRVNQAGNYTLLVTDADGCTAVDTIVVSQKGNITPSLLDTSICSGDSLFFGNHWLANTGVYYDTLAGKFGCDSILELALRVEELPVVEIFGDTTSCIEEVLELSVDEYPEIYWSTGEAGSIARVMESGIYQVTVVDENGCEGYAETSIQVTQLRKYELSGPPGVTQKELLRILNLSADDLPPVRWEVIGNVNTLNQSDSSIVLKVDQVSELMVIVHPLFSDPCLIADTLFVDILPNYEVYVPNVFSPNGDGINDFLTVYNADFGAVVLKLQMFNRWGGMIWESNQFLVNQNNAGWNGMSKGEKVDPGVYLWQAEVQFSDGTIRRYSGDVLVIR